jgi:hypothetical protein
MSQSQKSWVEFWIFYAKAPFSVLGILLKNSLSYSKDLVVKVIALETITASI